MQVQHEQAMNLKDALGLVWTRALEENIDFVSWTHLDWAVKHMTGQPLHWGETLRILVADWGWMADHLGAYPHSGEKETCR